jgi:hypothetical protein
LSSINQEIEVFFHLQKTKLSFIDQLEVVFLLYKNVVVSHLQINLGRLPFTKKMRSSSILSLVNTTGMLWFTSKVTFGTIPAGWLAGWLGG